MANGSTNNGDEAPALILDGSAFGGLMHQLAMEQGIKGDPLEDENVGVAMERALRCEAVRSRLMFRIISFYPNEATKLPLKFKDHEDNDLSAEEPYASALSLLDRIGAYNSFRDALIGMQMHQRHYLIIGNPSDSPTTYAGPLELLDENIRLMPCGCHELHKKTTAPGSLYVLTKNADTNAKSVEVHPSRVICFEDNNQSDLSLLEQLYPAVNALQELYPQLGELVRSYSTATLGIDNLTTTLAKRRGTGMSGTERIKERLRLWRMSLSIFNAAIFDRRTEEMNFTERNATSIDLAYKPLINRVVGLSGVPESNLFLVRQSGGALNDSGTRESMIAAGFTQQMQRDIMPQWQQLLRLILPDDDSLHTMCYQSTVVLSNLDQAEETYRLAQAAKEEMLAAKAEAETHKILCEIAALKAGMAPEVQALAQQLINGEEPDAIVPVAAEPVEADAEDNPDNDMEATQADG